MAEAALGLIVLRSSHSEACLAFYSTIGLCFVEEKHGTGPKHYSCPLGNVVMEIYPGMEQEARDYRGSGATLLGFRVADLDAVLAEMDRLNVTVLTPSGRSAWGRRAVVQDPDGRAVELNEPDKA